MTIKELKILADIVDALYLVSEGNKEQIMYKCYDIVSDINRLISEKEEKGERKNGN